MPALANVPSLFSIFDEKVCCFEKTNPATFAGIKFNQNMSRRVRRFRSAMLLIVSQGARLAGPSLALLLLAALWPAGTFGSFASAYALASLVGLLPATGLSAWLLDRSARQPGAARPMLRRAWLLLAGFGIAAVGLAGCVSVMLPDYSDAILPTLTLAMLLAGAADNGFAALRAQRREDMVAVIALPANAALLASAALLHGDGAEAIACAWAGVRGVQVLALSLAAARTLPRSTSPGPPLRQVWPFFGSQSAGVVYGQADTLLVHALAGEVAAGLYNVAARLLQLASFGAQTLAQWFQPRLAAAPAGSTPWLRQRRFLRIGLGVTAIAGAAGFGVIGPALLPPVLGPAYAAAAPVIKLAGLVLIARCVVAGQWIELTAWQREAHRAGHSWLLLALFLTLAWPLTLQFGGLGTMAAHLLALGPIAALSGRSLARARQT